MRTPQEWEMYCVKHFKGGYTPGGKARDLYRSGVALAKLLYDWDVWKPGDTLADVGCGNGRLAMGLIGQAVNYHGMDVVKASIEFCKEAFSGDGYARFAFYHLDVINGHYNPKGKVPADQVVYPLKNDAVNVVVANSLFSHTETLQVAERNLREMLRVLMPQGKLFTTWRLVPPLESTCDDARYTNYLRSDVIRLIEDLRLEIIDEVSTLPREIPNPVKEAQTGFFWR